jgi:hypothetical protein
MSGSEKPTSAPKDRDAIEHLLDQLEEVIDATLDVAEVFDPQEAAKAVRLLALATKLYGGLSRTDGAEDMPMGIPATTTDAATTAAVLILSQNLSLFEFNIWYSRVADAAERQQRTGAQ